LAKFYLSCLQKDYKEKILDQRLKIVVDYQDQNEMKQMITVSKDGPYLIAVGIDLAGDNIQWAEGSSKEIIFLVVVVFQTTNYSVMVCIY
jgi:hypothetical protein